MKYVIICLVLFGLWGCKEKQEEATVNDYSSSRRDENANYSTPKNYTYSEPQHSVGFGDYEAEVEYYNPETGRTATYNLSVDIENGELVKIYFPKGGWWDDTNFSPVDISDGEASFITYDGKSITVRLLDDIETEDMDESDIDDDELEDDEDSEDDNDNL